MEELRQEIAELKEERRALILRQLDATADRVDIIDGRLTAIDNRLAALTTALHAAVAAVQLPPPPPRVPQTIGYAVQVFDVDPILDAFSTNGGFRQFICNEARRYGLTGYVHRLRTHHAEIVFEGDEEFAEAFYDFLQGQVGIMFSSLVVPHVGHAHRRFYQSFRIERNSSVTCVKGDHSPDGWETLSVSSADQPVLQGTQINT